MDATLRSDLLQRRRVAAAVFNVVLFQPEIPANTGNIVRLCANTGCRLHLIHPLGFTWDDRRLKRAGLDYHEYASVVHYDSVSEAAEIMASHPVALTTHGTRPPSQHTFNAGDWMIFGSETRGLPPKVMDAIAPARRLRLPMVAGSRSMNLSNAVSAAVFEAWRQLNFEGAA